MSARPMPPPPIERLVVALLTAFVFTIPFEEIVTIPGVGSLTRLLGFAVMAAGLAGLVRGGRLSLRAPMLFHVIALAFVLWNLMTYFWSYEPPATIQSFVQYAQLWVFTWLMAQFARTPDRFGNLMQAFVLGNVVTLAFVVDAVFLQASAFRELGRFNANEVSIVAALAIPMAMALLTYPTRHRWRWVNAAYVLVAVAIIVLSASRGGLIVGLIALVSVPFALARVGVATRALVLAVVVGALVAAVELAPRIFPDLQVNLERLAGTGEEIAGGTLTGRTLIWDATLETFWDSPLVGVGAGAPRFALVETDLARSVAIHNAYLSVAAGGGLIALGLFLTLIVLAAAGAWYAPAGMRPHMVVLLLVLVVAMLPANVEGRKFAWFTLTLLACHRPLVLAVWPVRRTTPSPVLGADGTTRAAARPIRDWT